MAVKTELIFVLFNLVSLTVSSDVYRLVGSSVQLDIQDPVPEFVMLSWVLNGDDNIIKYYKTTKKTKQYSGEGRVEFNEETYSLTLKNLQKTDSGLYEAQASVAGSVVVAEHRLSVLDPVEAPVLTHQLNGDACNITLTCRGHDLSISSSCYNETCEEKEVTSPGGITLSLSVSGSTIICNHSNPVSLKKDDLEMGELKRLCADKGAASNAPSAGVSWCLLKTLLYSIVLIFILSNSL
ncbi:SLAM family member 9-like [Colossoma macropomum]|uniref:SLAM family member 9-like n=1 Tax=Colossoma macropomum TaxID=42526 RepID=UPI0018640851|nr:SLAM family member 9-like [Colossoma macropomum]